MTYKKKLIEVALPLNAINKASAREKSIRHGHPSTLHLWWARRPLASARAVLWASLVDDPSAHPEEFPSEVAQEEERQRLFRILEELILWENSNSELVLDVARAEILASCDGVLPNILDPFCGGGTIPLEAQRLGLPAYGGDLNPVAVLISKAMVEIPPRFAGVPPVNPVARSNSGLKTWERAQGLAEDIHYYGQWMRDRAHERIGDLYPSVDLPPEMGGGEANAIAWIWVRTVESPDPSWSGHVPLVGSWVLRKPRKNKSTIWIQPIVDQQSQTIRYELREGGDVEPPTRVSTRGDFRCLATGASIPNSYVREEAQAGRMSQVLTATVAEGPTGRAYVGPVSIPQTARPQAADVPGPQGGRYMAPPLYGMAEWGDLFSDRQLTAIDTFSNVLSELRPLLREHAVSAGLRADGIRLRSGGRGADAYADALVTYLAFAVDRAADKWATAVPWHSGGEKVEHVFNRQAIAMVWQFAEANPFSDSTGNWMGMIDWIQRVVSRLPADNSQESEILQRDAAARVTEVPSLVVSTDPPYYDNISYADLSDFFYIWLRRNLRDIWPDELSTLLTPKAEELIANEARAGSKDAARLHFESGMESVFEQVAESADPSFPITIFYAFKQEESDSLGTASTGWETFIQGLITAGLSVTATWPVRTELTHALKGKIAALASSVVLAVRPRGVDAPLATRAEFLAELRGSLPRAVRLMQRESIAPVDMAQSALGPGMATFSKYSKVIEANGSTMSVRQAMVLINEVLEEVLSEEETEFDADTRWALTWFEQYGLSPGSFGDAETLSKAKGTSIAGVVQSGITVRTGGKIRLLDRVELDGEWDPLVDSRLTVWEVAQHLITRLSDSETIASDLLRRVGPGMGERARMLAYLLFQIADRKGWSSEAVAYNGLVQAWPELTRLASGPAGPAQQTLGE